MAGEGDEIVRAIRWFAGGRCLVESEVTGETFTAARLLPGERASVVRFVRGGRRVPVAREILVASPERTEPLCRHFDRCTGCDLLHVSEEEEVRFKRLTIREVLARHAGLEVDHVGFVGGPSRGRHRARATFSVEGAGGESVRMGLGDFGGAILDAPDCPANRPEVEAIAIAVRAALTRPAAAPVRRVEIGWGVPGAWVIVEGEGPADDLHTAALTIAAAGSAGATGAGATPVAAVGVRVGGGEVGVVSGEWPAPLPVGGIDLEPALGAWTQPTPERASALYAWVRELGLHVGKRVLDATCGAGGLSLHLAVDAEDVLGVDASWAAVQTATRSAARTGLRNVAFRGGKIGTVAQRLDRAGERFHFTVVNPMRVSLGSDAMGAIASLTTEALLYLAPAPRAGAADIRALVEAGFAVREVAAVNLHPGSAKVMLAAVLGRV